MTPFQWKSNIGKTPFFLVPAVCHDYVQKQPVKNLNHNTKQHLSSMNAQLYKKITSSTIKKINFYFGTAQWRLCSPLVYMAYKFWEQLHTR